MATTRKAISFKLPPYIDDASTRYQTIVGSLLEHDQRHRGNDYICPAHDDNNPSLGVALKNGKVLVHCSAGCETRDVMKALGLSMRFLSNGRDEESVLKAVYQYTDENGKALFEVVRLEPKEFRQRRLAANGKSYIWSTKGVRRVLYRLPKVKQAIKRGLPIYAVEGEDDVHAIERAGGVATTNPGGAGKWTDEYSKQLKGASELIIVADRDDAGAKFSGQRHAVSVAASVSKLGIPSRIVQAREGKDASDHLAAGHGLDDFDEFEPPEEPESDLDGFRHTDLVALLKGKIKRPETSLLKREDGKALLYRQQIHWVYAEPEAGKTWLALVAAAEVLKAGGVVVYFDWEDSVEGIVGRLVALGVPNDVLARNFRYISPPGSITSDILSMLESEELNGADLVILDACTEAMVAEGLDPERNRDIEEWTRLLPRRAQTLGATVIVIDHVVKNRDSRGRWAIGGGHKLGTTYVGYSMRTIEPFAPGAIGKAAIDVTKDRSGSIRAFSADRRRAAVLGIDARRERVSAVLSTPDETITPLKAINATYRKLLSSPEPIPRTRTQLVNLIGGRAANARNVVEEMINAGQLIPAGMERGHPLYVPAPPARNVDFVPESEEEDDDEDD